MRKNPCRESVGSPFDRGLPNNSGIGESIEQALDWLWLLGLLSLFVWTWQAWRWLGRRTTRNVATQSQTTYCYWWKAPRFNLLHPMDQGAFPHYEPNTRVPVSKCFEGLEESSLGQAADFTMK